MKICSHKVINISNFICRVLCSIQLCKILFIGIAQQEQTTVYKTMQDFPDFPTKDLQSKLRHLKNVCINTTKTICFHTSLTKLWNYAFYWCEAAIYNFVPI